MIIHKTRIPVTLVAFIVVVPLAVAMVPFEDFGRSYVGKTFGMIARHSYDRLK
jgi:hypothetical protein